MDDQTVIAIAAAVIALLAMAVTVWQAAEARKSRKAAELQVAAAVSAAHAAEQAAGAAERSAVEADKASTLAEQQLELERQRDERARRERDERETEQAKLVTYGGASNAGALAVRIRNDSALPVRALRLDAVVATDDPSWGWQPRATARAKRVVQTLDGNKVHDFQIEMIRDGKIAGAIGSDYTVTFSFTDTQGVRWSRTGNNEPQRVEG